MSYCHWWLRSPLQVATSGLAGCGGEAGPIATTTDVIQHTIRGNRWWRWGNHAPRWRQAAVWSRHCASRSWSRLLAADPHGQSSVGCSINVSAEANHMDNGNKHYNSSAASADSALG
ncbi:hypothetical protein QOT17_004342 [Balamuthia mandrillaris]